MSRKLVEQGPGLYRLNGAVVIDMRLSHPDGKRAPVKVSKGTDHEMGVSVDCGWWVSLGDDGMTDESRLTEYGPERLVEVALENLVEQFFQFGDNPETMTRAQVSEALKSALDKIEVAENAFSDGGATRICVKGPIEWVETDAEATLKRGEKVTA